MTCFMTDGRTEMFYNKRPKFISSVLTCGLLVATFGLVLNYSVEVYAQSAADCVSVERDLYDHQGQPYPDWYQFIVYDFTNNCERPVLVFACTTGPAGRALDESCVTFQERFGGRIHYKFRTYAGTSGSGNITLPENKFFAFALFLKGGETIEGAKRKDLSGTFYYSQCFYNGPLTDYGGLPEAVSHGGLSDSFYADSDVNGSMECTNLLSR